jgi:hypothetical protein
VLCLFQTASGFCSSLCPLLFPEETTRLCLNKWLRSIESENKCLPRSIMSLQCLRLIYRISVSCLPHRRAGLLRRQQSLSVTLLSDNQSVKMLLLNNQGYTNAQTHPIRELCVYQLGNKNYWRELTVDFQIGNLICHIMLHARYSEKSLYTIVATSIKPIFEISGLCPCINPWPLGMQSFRVKYSLFIKEFWRYC